MVIDIIDRFVHNRVPERLTQRSMGPSTVQHQTSLPSDAFSSAINDAEQQALALLNRGIDLPLPDIDDDNQDD